MKILIIEDEAELAESMVYLLKQYDPVIASDFKEAREVIESENNKFDAIICDMNFYGVRDGENIYNYVRETLGDIPFIFHSSDIGIDILKIMVVDKNLNVARKPSGMRVLHTMLDEMIFDNKSESA